MKNILILLVTLLALSSCSKSKVGLDEVFEIQQGQSVTIADVKVSLDSVEDSRCPSDAVCIHAGWAIAYMTFVQGAEKSTQKLKILGLTNPPKADTVNVFGKKAILIDVLPYPSVNNNIQQKDYKVKMKLE